MNARTLRLVVDRQFAQARLRTAPANEAPAPATGRWATLGPDIDYMYKIDPLWDFLLDYYFRAQTAGWSRIPPGPCLVIGVHAGTWLTMDAWVLVACWWKRFGEGRILRGTAHDVLMKLPALGNFFRRTGVVPACREAVGECLAAGQSVAVWPGGEQDSMRSYRKRNEVVFAGRRGFVKQAIASGVPIVPVATVGGAETVFVLSEGRWLAKALMCKKWLRSDMAPIVAGLPFGIWLEALPTHIPLPAQIRSEFLEPVYVEDDPDRVNDDAYVNRIYEEVRLRIADGVARLTKERRWPILG